MRIPPVGEGPALRDHPPVEIRPGEAAHRHDAAVVVPIAFLACNGTSADSTRKRPRRLAAARPLLAARPATLLGLRCVDSVQANPDTSQVEGVAVDHSRGTRERARTTGNANRLDLPDFRRVPAGISIPPSRSRSACFCLSNQSAERSAAGRAIASIDRWCQRITSSASRHVDGGTDAIAPTAITTAMTVFTARFTRRLIRFPRAQRAPAILQPFSPLSRTRPLRAGDIGHSSYFSIDHGKCVSIGGARSSVAPVP